jgi:hypothetical protein
MIGTNLVWACGSVRLSLKRKACAVSSATHCRRWGRISQQEHTLWSSLLRVKHPLVGIKDFDPPKLIKEFPVKQSVSERQVFLMICQSIANQAGIASAFSQKELERMLIKWHCLDKPQFLMFKKSISPNKTDNMAMFGYTPVQRFLVKPIFDLSPHVVGCPQGSIFRWSRDQRCHLKNKGRLIGAKIQLDVGGSRTVPIPIFVVILECLNS